MHELAKSTSDLSADWLSIGNRFLGAFPEDTVKSVNLNLVCGCAAYVVLRKLMRQETWVDKCAGKEGLCGPFKLWA